MKKTLTGYEPTDADTVIVCRRWADDGFFADDLRAPCDFCGEDVRFRPTAPQGFHMCANCFVEEAKQSTEPIEVGVTPTTLRELALYKAKTGPAH
jgi:hypothetical protein